MERPVAIVGGGPAGSVAALCLRKLGREVVLFERDEFPRYRIGESLLPGTLSILHRLGLAERIEAAGFPKKRAATFLWGEDRPPWSFTFATPKTAPWVYDHAYQVTRAEFDAILLDAARERGAEVRTPCRVKAVDLGDPVRVSWQSGAEEGTLEASFVIDASGAAGVVANQLGVREFDEFYRNLAVWSYFRGGRRFGGDLEGNIFSVTWKEGWIWIIPQKDDMYSVGVVTDLEAGAQRIREIGAEAFFEQSLESQDFARDLLADAERCDAVRVCRDWAYSARETTAERAFLCGDSAMFIDPLFSQGVHLATYSAMLAAASIDRLLKEPDAGDAVRSWFDRSYQQAYDRYHRFLSSFYAYNQVPSSAFWSARRIQGAEDHRFAHRDWFRGLSGREDAGAAEAVGEGAATLAELWHHESPELSDSFDETELSMRRLRWAAELQRDLRRMKKMRWRGADVRLEASFVVDPLSFELEDRQVLGDGNGRRLASIPLTADHRDLFASLATSDLSYRDLQKRLAKLEASATPLQIVGRLIEEGLLEGLDENGKPIALRFALRFGGVGGEDDLS